MKIGGLDITKPISSTAKDSAQSTNGKGFTRLFGSLVKDSSQASKVSSDNSSGKMTKEDIEEMIHLLKIDDILDAENGLQILHESLSVNSQEELLALIEETVVSSVKLKDLIQQLQLDLQVSDGDIIVEEIQGSNIPGEVKIEDLLVVLSQITAMPLKDLKVTLNDEMGQLIKAAKLFDLLAAEQGNSNEQGQLKELIQQLTKKLEQLTDASMGTVENIGKQSTRLEYLQKTFSTVAAELNAKLLTGTEGQSEQKNAKIAQPKIDPVTGTVHLQQMSKAEQLTLTLTESGKPTNSTDLIKQFENILARSKFTNTGGAQKLMIKLNPEHLGTLRIELIQREAGIVARIMATTQVAKESLESHLNGLKHAFGSQNIQVDRVEVSQTMSQQQERFLGREQEQQSQQQEQRQQENNQKSNDVGENSFNAAFEESLVNTEV